MDHWMEGGKEGIKNNSRSIQFHSVQLDLWARSGYATLDPLSMFALWQRYPDGAVRLRQKPNNKSALKIIIITSKINHQDIVVDLILIILAALEFNALRKDKEDNKLSYDRELASSR